MERRTVRIYKAPNGQGEYINKTGQFLKKAQMGAETTNEAVMQQKQLEPIMQFVAGALDNEMEPEEIMKLLVSKGLPKELVYSVISSVMQEREAPEEEETEGEKEKPAEETKIGQSEFQPIGEEEAPEEDQAMEHFNSYADESEPVIEEEYQDGGPILSYGDLESNNEESSEVSPELIQKLTSLKDFFDKTPSDDFKDFGKDISEYEGVYTPVEWDVLGDGYGYYKKGGSKKNFTKNVLALIKKAEGGDTQSIGQGNKKDTLTNDVSKIKSSFVNKLKEVSSKAAIDSLYEKMMKSNDPALMQSAQELAQKRQQNSQMGTFEPVAQQGGYIGEGQPDMFAYGGFDLPEAQKGFAQRLGDALLGEKYIVANNPYNVKTGALYKDPLTGLTPVARTVHKRGILGRPKQYTDYYSKNGAKPLTPGQEIKAAYEKQTSGKYGMPEELWDSLPGKAKREIRRGERKLDKELRRGEKLMEKEKNLTPAQEFFLRKEKEEEARKKNQTAMSERIANRWSSDMGMDDSKWWDNGTVEAALPEGLSDEDIEMINASNAEKENMLNFPVTEQQRVLETYLNPNSQLLNNSNKSDFEKNWYIPTIKNTVQTSEEFTPSSSMDDPGLNPYYKFSTGKSKATTRKEAEEEAMRMQMQRQGREAEYEKRYGGLPKAQVGVKSPTSGVSTASDPTANTGNLMDMLKPQQNPNTFMGASKPFMNQNTPVNKDPKVEAIQMDPNQIKDQKITSLDFKDDDSLIAQDVKTGRNVDPKKSLDIFNSGVNALSSFLEKRQDAKQEKNTFTADEVYTASTDKDRGDYVAYGQQTGMFRPDETGQQTSGRFAYGQVGGYMQSGGYTEGDEVEMDEDELREFLANGGEVEYLES